MISAWARMCKILGDQFVQYLPVVMKPLLHAAKMRPEVAIIDGECLSMCLCICAYLCVSVGVYTVPYKFSRDINFAVLQCARYDNLVLEIHYCLT